MTIGPRIPVILWHSAGGVVTRERVRQLQRNAERRLRERLVSECRRRDTFPRQGICYQLRKQL
jgi:hypothetical protein